MSTPDTPARFTLSQLPLPAKLVITVFLLSVGLGYFSALIQLHDKNSSKDGNPLPTPGDVVAVYSGVKEPDPNAPPPCSRLDTLLCGDQTAAAVTKDNMAPAFFAASKDWREINIAPRNRQPIPLEIQREGERLAMLAWVRGTDAEAKKRAYENDRFPLPDELKNQAITTEFIAPDSGVRIKSLIDARCQYCHKDQSPKLADYAAVEKWVTPPSTELIDGKWVDSGRLIPKEKLIQSTHAHALSFAVLFALTGLAFAFTSYSGFIRSVVAPLALVAEMADISCWWLARLEAPYGPIFALGIIGTGGLGALGLSMQIVLSIWNMWTGPRGKLLAILLLLCQAGALGLVTVLVLHPGLKAEKAKKAVEKDPTTKTNGPPKQVDPPNAKVSELERLVMGPREGKAWNKTGSMAPAFFDKDSSYKKERKDRKDDPAGLAALDAEREGERLAIQAWIKSDPAVREKAYADDAVFALPAELAGKPLTEEFTTPDKKGVKIKTLLDIRCAGCHGSGGEQDKFPLETYSQIMKYIDPKQAADAIPPAKN